MKEISHNIHNIGTFHWRCSANQEIVKKAGNDKSKRKFGVRFLLEDPRARTNYAYITLTKELSQHDKNDHCDIWYEKNKDGFLGSILIDIPETR